MVNGQEVSSLPPELRMLVLDLGCRITRAEGISPLPTNLKKRVSTFRLELDDGRVLKGRAGMSPFMIARIRRMLSELPRAHFSQMIASGESCIIEEWVDGHLVADGAANCASATMAGNLMGVIHAAGKQLHCLCPINTTRYIDRIKAALLDLILRNLIDICQAETILDALLNSMPENAEFGITHRDLSPQNLVLRQNLLVAIDNVLLNQNPLHEDLARTWYLWGFREDLFGVLLDSYQKKKSLGEFHTTQTFWKAFVLLRAAAMRTSVNDRLSAASLLKRLVSMVQSDRGFIGPTTRAS